MNENIDYSQDDRTVVVDRAGKRLDSEPLTTSSAAARMESLEQRLVHSAQLGSASAFNTSLNPLVAAAAGLLSQVAQFRRLDTLGDRKLLNQNLVEGVRGFEARALENGIERSQVMTARYVLCTVLDEAVVTAESDPNNEWAQMSLLSRFHQETFGGKKVFELLEMMSRYPARYLFVLELMYLCLAIGFEGKYRIQERGRDEIDAIRDALYRQIRQLRGDAPTELSPFCAQPSTRRRQVLRVVPAWMVMLLTGTCLVAMFSGFAWVLHGHRDTLLHSYQPFEPMAVPQQHRLPS